MVSSDLSFAFGTVLRFQLWSGLGPCADFPGSDNLAARRDHRLSQSAFRKRVEYGFTLSLQLPEYCNILRGPPGQALLQDLSPYRHWLEPKDFG